MDSRIPLPLRGVFLASFHISCEQLAKHAQLWPEDTGLRNFFSRRGTAYNDVRGNFWNC